MNAPILTSRETRVTAPLRLLGALDLPLARLHEACGPARHSFATLVAGDTSGPVLWIAPGWATDRPNPDGMRAITGPGTGPEHFVFVTPQRREDLLWCMEESLRSGAAPLVVADLPGPPGLTPVRRLHLAAEEGAGRGHGKPLGLILTPGDGGAPGVETRWHMAPAHALQVDRWRLERRRARTGPPAAWALSGRPGAWHLAQA
ncbi:ImuA family protein [Roseovarius sp. D22-M7]|uniref:ImuA family protein n=1 Tax=Roseovarius sp. D22-M7 TaxID=3127116 RepID=UPI00300FEB24